MIKDFCAVCGNIYLKSAKAISRLCPKCRENVPNPESKKCANPECGKDFVPIRTNQTFCSTLCRLARHNKRRKDAKYEKVCALLSCQKTFFGDKRARYCCHEHYIEAKRGAPKRPLDMAGGCTGDYVNTVNVNE